MNDEERIRNKRIADYFCKNEVKVHISKTNGIFYNGIIKEVSAEFIIINDVKDGEKLVFFKELKRPIEQFMEEI